jgi:DNA-binding MarR family transcriptional regulator
MDAYEAVFTDVVQVETALWNSLDRRLGVEHRLPMTMYAPLRVIADTDDCRVLDIAAALALTVGGTSKLVDRLVTAGFVLRRSNPTDRRSSLIVLTDAGKRMLNHARSTLEAELRRCLAGSLQSDELTQLGALLGRVSRGLAGMAVPDVAVPAGAGR